MITRPLLSGTLEDNNQVKFPVLATPKLDGIRILKVGGEVFTRKFKPLPNKFARDILTNILPDGIDGELMSSGSFNDIQSKLMSHDTTPDFVFYAFDYVKESLEKPYQMRMVDLENWWKSSTPDIQSKVHLVLPTSIANEEQLEEFKQTCIEQGYEGAMIRSPNGVYKCGRSTVKEGILLKIKDFIDAEAIVIGFEEKMTNQNEQEVDQFGLAKRSHKIAGMIPAGTLGALIVKDVQKNIEFKIGSGFDDEMKQNIWNNKEKYLNKLVTYKSQPSGAKDKPRFPIYKGFRSELDV